MPTGSGVRYRLGREAQMEIPVKGALAREVGRGVSWGYRHPLKGEA